MRRMARSSDLSWSNWDGRQRFEPAAFERPRTLQELAAALERAERSDARVRVAGSGHSFTALVQTDGILVSLEDMNRVLDLDRGSGLVRVQAGITIGQLNAELDQHGLGSRTSVNRQAIARGRDRDRDARHRARLRNLSGPVVAVELMRADGTLVSVDSESDPDAWRAARVSLGALGIVTALTIQTVPAFRLRGVDGPAPFERTLDGLSELPEQHDHFEMYWFPYVDTVLTRSNDRTDAPLTPRSTVRRYVEDILLVNHGLSAFSRTGRHFHRMVPRLNRTATRIAGSSDRVGVSHDIFVSPRLVRFTEMEYASPASMLRRQSGPCAR